jgi:hypothetical protein
MFVGIPSWAFFAYFLSLIDRKNVDLWDCNAVCVCVCVHPSVYEPVKWFGMKVMPLEDTSKM